MEIATILAGVLLIGGVWLIDQAENVKDRLQTAPAKSKDNKRSK